MTKDERAIAMLATMPLPDGWTAEPRHNRCLIISCSSIGGVTLDPVGRAVRPGYETTIGKKINDAKYTGRGWLAEMHHDAVAWLRMVGDKQKQLRAGQSE